MKVGRLLSFYLKMVPFSGHMLIFRGVTPRGAHDRNEDQIHHELHNYSDQNHRLAKPHTENVWTCEVRAVRKMHEDLEKERVVWCNLQDLKVKLINELQCMSTFFRLYDMTGLNQFRFVLNAASSTAKCTSPTGSLRHSRWFGQKGVFGEFRITWLGSAS